MSLDKIYPIFRQKIEDDNNISLMKSLITGSIKIEEQRFRVILLFDDISKRDQFVKENVHLNILKLINFIPIVITILTRKEIYELNENDLIRTIEEDQLVYLSILDVNEIIQLKNYRKTPIIFTGKNVFIGIIDDQINPNYDSIEDIIELQYFFSEIKDKKEDINQNTKYVTHGTLMANIIGNQYLDHNDKIIGIAPNAKIIGFNIFNEAHEYHFSNLLEVFDFLFEKEIKIDILLISFSTLEPSDGKDILSYACDLIADKGLIIVCPAGNFGPESFTIGSPGAAEKVITVGATTKDNKIAYFCGRGPTLDGRIKPDIFLPGSRITIPLSDTNRIDLSGTSISAAICIGIIANIKEYNPNMTYLEISEIFREASYEIYRYKKNEGKTIDLIAIFKKLNLFQEPVLPFSYLIKRSLKFAIESMIIILGIFFLFFYFPTIMAILESY